MTRWYLCPKCGKQLVRLGKNAKCEDTYAWCKVCKKEYEIKIK